MKKLYHKWLSGLTDRGLCFFRRCGAFCLLFAASMPVTSTVWANNLDKRYDFRIEEARLGDALEAMVQQTGLIVLYPHELADSTGMKPVLGSFTVSEAFGILFQGTAFSGGLTKSGVLYITLSVDGKNCDQEENVTAKQRRSSLFTTVSAFLFGAGSLSGAHAQQVDAESEKTISTIEEVIVAARKREERALDVPIALSAFSGSALVEANIDNIEDLIVRLPSTTFEIGDDVVSANITLRGVNRSLRSDEPAFGLYRDGVYIGGQISSFPTFYDIQSVEVLRGPQGALYGRNASAGAVSIITAQPVDKTEGQIDVKVANKDRQEYRAMLNTPLVADKFFVRAALMYDNQDGGFNYNPYLDDEMDAEENWTGRIRAKWLVNDDLDMLMTYEHTEKRQHSAGLAGVITEGEANNPANILAGIPGLGVPGVNATIVGLGKDDLRNNNKDFADRLNTNSDIGIVEANLHKTYGTFTGIASYREVDIQGQRDNDHTILNDKTDRRDISQESYYFEGRFASSFGGRFNFVGGVNYFREHRIYNTDQLVRVFPGIVGGNFYTGDVAFNDFFTGVLGLPAGPFSGITLEDGVTPLPIVTDGNGYTGSSGASFIAPTRNDQTTKSYAAFIEANYDVSDQVNVWASLRYTRDEKHIDYLQDVGNCDQACHAFNRIVLGLVGTGDTTTSGLTFASIRDDTYSQWSPGGGVTFTINENLVTYAKVVTGFKAGGYNENAAVPSSLPLGEETSISYEAGVKSQLLNRRLGVNFVVYHHKRKNTVIAIDDPGFPPGVNLIGANNADVKTDGAELEINAVPIEGLNINTNIGYVDATFSSFSALINNVEIDLSGNQIPLIYKWTASAQAIYRHQVPGMENLNMFYYALYTLKTKGYLNDINTEKSPTLHRMSVKLGVESETWRLIGYIDNLFDKVDIAYQNPREQFRLYTPGRTYGMQFVKNF